jgi:hypothetical protein
VASHFFETGEIYLSGEVYCKRKIKGEPLLTNRYVWQQMAAMTRDFSSAYYQNGSLLP